MDLVESAGWTNTFKAIDVNSMQGIEELLLADILNDIKNPNRLSYTFYNATIGAGLISLSHKPGTELVITRYVQKCLI